jgi:two-component system response regulator AtoC
MMRLLIADDDRNLTTVLTTELSESGYDVSMTGSGSNAAILLEDEDFDVLLLDLNMPGLGGIDVLKKIRTSEMPPEVIILTGHGTVNTAVEAMKLGAYDFLAKPFKLEELKAVIDKAYEKRKLLAENLLLKTQLRRQTTRKIIVTRNPLLLEILETARRVAVSDFPVLIYGETGVGKELFARTIHDASPRSDGPFIPINCPAIPENMIESELFGHEKGAFTGAYSRKMGLIEIAHNGTLFFDEIGELPLNLQVKLLRVLETRAFFRVGGVKEMWADVKFVAASNKELKAEVEKGNFRPDLYYRLSALTLRVPPLRERKEDIPLLIEHFTKDDADFRNKTFGREALDVLSAYPWPGNVRELQNVVHRTLLLSKNTVVDPDDLSADLFTRSATSGKRLREIEKDHILRVLKEVDGLRGKAAEILGIDPKTLYRKLSRYGLKR